MNRSQRVRLVAALALFAVWLLPAWCRAQSSYAAGFTGYETYSIDVYDLNFNLISETSGGGLSTLGIDLYDISEGSPFGGFGEMTLGDFNVNGIVNGSFTPQGVSGYIEYDDYPAGYIYGDFSTDLQTANADYTSSFFDNQTGDATFTFVYFATVPEPSTLRRGPLAS